ncbi:MAG: hypothetical protein Q9167_001669 [Letrouitia subvulpina]
MQQEFGQSSLALDEAYDLVCIGFGPASLAIAIALYDRGVQPRVLYLERQKNFIWHAGMLLPNARMQISFLKDLATLRNPRSKFTFINYLKSKNRLVAFTNLSTFLPLREEYNDYMTWCAAHFAPFVQYGQETISVSPRRNGKEPVQSWQVISKNVDTGRQSSVTAKHVVIAVGGKPKIPPTLTNEDSYTIIVHSSDYSISVPLLLTQKHKPYNLAVIGGGQSSAEIFNDLPSKYPNSRVTLFTGSSALKPSDDSPFVNEVFDPERTDIFYDLPDEAQHKSIASNKATNYGVVRPELLDHLYKIMYQQRLHEPDESKWQRQIIPWTEVTGYEKQDDRRVRLQLRDTSTGQPGLSGASYDLVIVGTGYERNAHEALLEPTRGLLLSERYEVERDYRVKYQTEAVAEDCGIWLQGCCEESHGLGDTLLSVLAVRGGEMAESIFPSREWERQGQAKL